MYFHIRFVLVCALLAVRWWEYLGWKVWFLPVKQVRQPGLLQGGAGPQKPGLVPAGVVGLLLLRDDRLQLPQPTLHRQACVLMLTETLVAWGW